MFVVLSPTFDTAQWVSVLTGVPTDPDALRRLRMAPPRVVMQPTVLRPVEVNHFDDHDEVFRPVAYIAKLSAVRPETVRGRARRWGFTLDTRHVGREGGGCLRQSGLRGEAKFQAFMARTYQSVGPVGRRVTSSAS